VIVAVMVADVTAADDFIARFNAHPDIAYPRLEGCVYLGIDGMAMVLAPGTVQVMAEVAVVVVSITVANAGRQRKAVGQLAPISDRGKNRLNYLARFLVAGCCIKS